MTIEYEIEVLSTWHITTRIKYYMPEGDYYYASTYDKMVSGAYMRTGLAQGLLIFKEIVED